MDDIFSALSMIGSLVLILLVLALAWYATRWYAKRVGGMGGVGAGKYVKVIDKTVLAPGTSLVIVEIGDKHYLLGVGDKNVRLLSELPPQFGQSVKEEPPGTAAPFSQVFRDMWDKSRKKDDDKR